MSNERGFGVSARTVKKHWFRENEIVIEITDGAHTIELNNYDFFTVDTDKPLAEQILWKGGAV